MGSCHEHCTDNKTFNELKSYRRILWICLVLNFLMFIIQTIASYVAHSVSLLANSADFLSDSINYGLSLYVINFSLQQRAKASIFKGISLAIVGFLVAYQTLSNAFRPELPEPILMTIISIVALIVNVVCAIFLYRYREGDSNRESVWICSRNDAIGNIAVMIAAAGVFTSGTIWPDIIVAAILCALAVSGAWRILLKAKKELV